MKEDRLSLYFESDAVSQTDRPKLQSQVQQIIAQRGAFRNINEETLRKEIGQPNASVNRDGDDAMQSDHNGESDEETAQARQEKLWKSREEMLQKLSYAQNEILSALDFVSLLLSNHSKAAQASMSPALTAVVQPGTLEAKAAESRQIPTKTKARLTKVSEGWKSESFGSAASKLGKAAARLNLETEGQGKYWEQIAHLKTEGWAISRLPSDSRAIGVHFGFPESAPQFRTRGFALLQQDEDGNLEFDARLAPKRAEPIKFIIKRKGVETGCFTATTTISTTSMDMNWQLLLARDSLFEEELFYEINREARLIANQDVQTQAKAVEALISEEYSIRIVQPGSRKRDDSTGSDDQLARFVGLGSWFLLTAEHARLHSRRSQPPTPMALVAPSTPEYAILRPIITHLRHQDSVANSLKLYQSLSKPFKHAGISFDIGIEQKLSNISINSTPQVSQLRGPARTSITIKLTSGRSLTLDLETFLGAPIYGTIYRNSAVEYSFSHLQPAEMHDLDEVRAFSEHLLSLELVHIIEKLAKEQSVHSLRWSLARPHLGELSIGRGAQKLAKVVAVVEAGKIMVSVSHTGKELPVRRDTFVWMAEGCWSSFTEGQNQPTAKTLKVMINEISKSLQP